MKRFCYCCQIILIILSLSFFSCRPKDSSNFSDVVVETQMPEIKTISKKTHKWYYFTYEGFKQTSGPQNAPQVLLKPWTEAIRISSGITISNEGFLTVNKLGLLSCEPQDEVQAKLAVNNQFFADLTVDNITSVDGFPVFHVYKNPEFNTTESAKTNHPFLVQYHPESSVFMPLLYTEDLEFSKGIEVSDVVYKDSEWAITLKSADNTRKDFEYLTFSSYESLITTEPNKRKDIINTTEISEGEYRTKILPKNFAQAPQRVKSLLSRLPNNFEYYIEIFEPNSGMQTSYIKKASGKAENSMLMDAQVILNDTFSLAVFTDGTSFFEGAIQDKYVVNNGNPIAFRLPKLPMGFSYSTFVVEKNILYIAWEEKLFYEIGRTGFLTVDLDKVFY